MIAEALIGGATVCFVASLQFAKWCLRREDETANRPSREALAEKRRVLERDRAEWHETLSRKDAGARTRATAAMAEIDAKLIKLADEISDD